MRFVLMSLALAAPVLSAAAPASAHFSPIFSRLKVDLELTSVVPAPQPASCAGHAVDRLAPDWMLVRQ